MKVQAYNAEYYERTSRWYIIFGTIVAGIIILSITHQNIVGAVLLFFLLGGYFYYSISNRQTIELSATEQGLTIHKKSFHRSDLTGYVLEVNKKTQKLHNIVFLRPKGYSIHTFQDETQKIKQFILELNEHLPMFKDYNQSTLEKIFKVLKI